MNDETLASLHVALATSPANLSLRMVLVDAHLGRGEVVKAVELLDAVDPGGVEDPAHQCTAARAALEAADPELALSFARGDAPEISLWRARALVRLGRRDEARSAYRAAVEANPTLEDTALDQQLASREREVAPATPDGPRLRVISNDDTDESEVTRLLHPAQPAVRFEDVGGLEHVKKQIHKRIILPFLKPSLFRRFKRRVGGGILLYGPPGCGKTLLARATAGECDATFFNVAISDVLDMWIGESERKLHALFDKARQSAPAVMFFDELEALAGKRQYTRDGAASKLVSQFLAEMDGFAQNNHGVLILGATNVPWAVDPAFRRPGRFDRMLFVPPPDREARGAILELLLRERPVARDVDTDLLSKGTGGFSGADLANLVEAASDEAIEASLEQGEEVPIALSHLRDALEEVRPTTTEWLTTARNYARYANEGGQYDEVLRFLERHGKG